MKKVNHGLMSTIVIALVFAFSSCKNDEPVLAKTSYDLGVKDELGVTGTATFIETSNTTVTIELVLKGAATGTHPADLCMGSAVENGGSIISLNPVDATGKSSTTVSNMTYNQLIAYDGYIKVRKSASQPDIILAIGDIGGNVITSTQKSYTLQVVGTFGVSGTALFQKRTNGNTLVTISLTGTISGESYPATINIGSVTTVGGGDVKKTLNPVDGSTGKSYTNIKSLDNNTSIKYEDWLLYDGYIAIYQKTLIISNIISQGNIGSNVAP